MLKFQTGDMFKQSADARVNTVNCVGVMGKGVSLEFRGRYPGMFLNYQTACQQGLIKPGGVWEYWLRDQRRRPRVIYNMATKNHWRDPSQYAWIKDGLDTLAFRLRTAVNKPIRVLTMPAIGCGNGGLDWNIVRPMVEKSMKKLSEDLGMDIYVFEPN